MTAGLHEALKAIPEGLRRPLISEFEELVKEYRLSRWESVGLKAGKLAEIIFSIVQGKMEGAYPTAPSKPKNMLAACTQLENIGAGHSRSIRIQIPRLLVALYELRNNRDVGHIGGEVNPNHMDAELFLRLSKWLISELIRIFAQLPIKDSQALVETVTEKIFPAIWEGNGFKRVLNAKLSTSDKALVLAYCTPGVTAKQLASWIGYSNFSRFVNEILKNLHDNALIHFNQLSGEVAILPPGTRRVEINGLMAIE